MANRVSVNINVNDLTRAGLASVRRSLRRVDNQMRGMNHRINLTLNDDGTRAGIRRTRRAIRRLPNHVNINTRLNPPRNPRNGLVRSLTAPVRAAGRVLGGTLSDGLGQGVSNGFKNAGPVIQAALAVAILGALSFVGAALAGALVLVIGGAFVAAAAAIAFQADGVKKKWTDTLSELKPLFADAASGMLPVIEHARKQFERVGKDFAPHFKQAIDASAPHVQSFMDNIIEGFRKLGSRAAVPLEEAFNTFLAAFGPDMEDMLAGLGDALRALANTVRDNSGHISMALTGVIGLITTAVDIVNFFANAWVTMVNTGTKSIGIFIGALGMFLDFVLGVFGTILQSQVEAWGWIPGLGGKLKDASKSFGTFRESVKSDMQQMSEKFMSTGDRLDHMNRERKLKVDIASWENQLRRARADLKKTSSQKAEAKVRANIKDLQNKISRARGQLNSLNGKTAHTYVITHMQARKEGAHGTQLGYAHGGVIGAAATGGVRSNMTLVGEQGPELVDLPGGSRVRSNSDSRRLAGMGGGSGGDQPIIVQFVLDGRQVGEAMIDPLRGVISSKGGNVQKVLGKGGR